MSKREMNEEEVKCLFAEMRQLIDDKIASLKNSIPIVFTVVTSIMAFLISQSEPIDPAILKIYFLILGIAAISFIILLVAYKVFPYYKSVNSKKKQNFAPWNIETYWGLSNSDFLEALKKYIGRDFSDLEIISAKFLKQRVNEFRFKSRLSNVVHTIMIAFGIMLVAASAIVIILGVG